MVRSLAVLFLVAGLAAAQTDPLPEHALARFGTTRFRTGCTVDSLAFSPDGRQIVSWGEGLGKPGELAVWDATTGRKVRSVRTPPYQRVQAFGWAADRPGLAVFKRAGMFGGNRDLITDLTVWDFTAEPPAKLDKPEEIDVRPGDPTPMVLDAIIDSPDGRRLAVGTSVDDKPGTVVIYDLKPARSLADLKRLAEFAAPPCLCRTLSFTPDGKRLVGACAADDAKAATIVVWDAAGKIERTFDAPVGSGAANLIATDTTAAIELETGNTFLVGLDGRSGRTVPTAHKRGPDGYGFLNFAFQAGGKGLITTGSDGMIRLTDVATGKVTRSFGASWSWPRVLAVSPDGRRVATSGWDAVIRVWDLATGKDAIPLGGHYLKVERVSASAEGRVVVTAGKDETIRIWDAVAGKEQRTIPVGGPILDCRLTPDSRHVVAAVGPRDGPGRSLRMWDVGTGAEAILAWFTQVSAAGFRFTPDGQTLLTHADNHLAAWTWPAGKKVWSADVPAAADDGINRVDSLAVSPDGRHFVTASEFRVFRDPPWWGPGAIDLWETATGRRARRLAEAKIPFRSVGFAGDGTVFFHGHTNWNVRGESRKVIGLFAIDLRTGKLVREFDAGSGEALAVSADGRVLFWAMDIGEVQLYEVATGQLRVALPGHRDTVLSLDAPASDVRRVLSGSADTTALWWDVGFHGKPATLSGEERASLWKELGEPNAKRGFEAMRKLAADPTGFVALAAGELKPVPPGPTEAELARHFKNLDANSFVVREAAARALEGYGETALSQARARLDVETAPEARERLTKFVDRHTKPDNDPERLRQGRAVELLEHLGTPEAKELLAKLAKGGPAKLTTDAGGSAKRLASQ